MSRQTLRFSSLVLLSVMMMDAWGIEGEKGNWVPLDLAPGGVFMTIDVPAKMRVSGIGTSATIHWSEEGAELTVHALAPTETSDDLAAVKKRLSGKNVKVLVDTKDAYAAGIPVLGDDNFQCYVRVTTNEKTWWWAGKNLTEEEALLATQAAKTLRRTPANTKAEQAMKKAVAKLETLDCNFKSGFQTLVLTGERVQDADLAIAKNIPQVAWVIVEDAPKLTVEGFNQLLSMPSVESVTLQGENITDAWLEPLRTVSGLKRVWLQRTRCSDKAIAQLKIALPDGEFKVE